MFEKLEIMYEKSIPINVLTLCIGFKYNYLSYTDFKNYALLKFLTESETLKAVNLGLFDMRDNIELEEKIANIFVNQNEEVLFRETEKWLYVQLLQLMKNEHDNEKLLNKVAELYADFNYPAAMEHFINYMPTEADLSCYTVEQAQARLINLCNNFLNTLEKKLMQNNVS